MSEPPKKWFGDVTRWRDGERLYAKNDFCTLVYVVTDDPNLVGELDLHGADRMCVKLISAEQAKLWETLQ